MDWVTEHTRAELDPSCTAAGREGTILLWGDSFAQALSLGIREQLPPGTVARAGRDLGVPPRDRQFRHDAFANVAARKPTFTRWRAFGGCGLPS